MKYKNSFFVFQFLKALLFCLRLKSHEHHSKSIFLKQKQLFNTFALTTINKFLLDKI